MTPSKSTDAPSPKPGGDPVKYFVSWLSELKELHEAGLVEDEDYAYQRAEKISELLDCPSRSWLGWLYVGVPLGLVSAAVTWRLFESVQLSGALAGIAALCALAALGRRSRERFADLVAEDRLAILRQLLAADVVTSAEFAGFEERMLRGEQEKSAA